MPQLDFNLNGHPTTADYADGMHLLEVLREKCGIKTAKDGCAPQGYCGCCTVLIDGKPVPSCLRKPEQAAGRDVTTLEGISEQERQVLARAFVQDGAIQCGYCIPGIVTRAAALLRQGKRHRDEIARGLSGHLCRCTGFTRILDAIETAGEALDAGGELPRQAPRRASFFGGNGSDQPLPRRGVGSCMPRYRGLEHALGEKDYVADMEIEGMVHAAAVLAEHPRARLLGVDPSAALALPGVLRVLSADDVPGAQRVGLIVEDWPVMTKTGEITRSVGEIVAFAIADSPFNARQAAAAVEVDYEVLEPVDDPFAALEPASPLVHPERHSNLLETCCIERGNVDAALAGAAHVLRHTFSTQRIEHAFLEPEACLAVPDAAGSLKIYTQGQGVHDDRRQIAAVLAMPEERIEVELIANGGAFGGKEDLSIQAHTALAALLLGRPVRAVLSREESIRMHSKRHPIVLDYTVGADAEGRLLAVRARITGDTGAYASVGMKVLERAAGHSCGPYKVPNVDVEARTVYTNNPPCGAMRGFGANQAAFAIEGMMDLLAERVGADGYDIRERNLLDPGDRFATGQKMTESCGVRQTLEAVREVYKASKERAGIACGIKNTGIGNGMDDSGRLKILVREGGGLEIVTGYTEMGQGLFTILCQVVAEETGLEPEIMKARTVSDPDVVCGMTTASRATALLTSAGQQAARRLAADLAHERLVDLAGREYHGETVLDFTTKPGHGDPHDPKTHVTFSYATQVVILAEDGTIERVIAAHDVGRAIHPLQCAGQIEGSVHMGLGYALSEDLPTTGARPNSLLLRDLGILKAKDTPPIEVILIEVPDEFGGYGAKGIGEIGLVPTAGAVAAALHAHDGRRRFHLPMADAPAARASVPKSRR